jgi:uncharacterized protein involved in tellurium resistance
MSDYTKRWIELRRRERQTDGTWSCHYVIFEFGTKEWRCKKGVLTVRTPEEAEIAALNQAQQIVDSLQTLVSDRSERDA